MYIKRTVNCTVDQYNAMTSYLKKHNYKFDVEFDRNDEEFIFTYTTEEDYYASVMSDLKEMQQDTDNFEFFDSLNTAIAAVKTIADMQEGTDE